MGLVGQAYDEPGSWGRLSEGWPEIRFRTKEEYDEAWAFVVANKPRRTVVPYGSYVGMMKTEYHGYGTAPTHTNFVIRVETPAYKLKVQNHMKHWRVKIRAT